MPADATSHPAADAAEGRLGVFVIGARGSVATLVALGAHAIAGGLHDATGMVTASPACEHLSLIGCDCIELGGYDVRQVDLAEQARVLERERAAPPSIVADAGERLRRIDSRIRPGHLFHCGEAIESLATAGWARRARCGQEVVADLQADLQAFAAECGATRLLVVNLASTEPPASTPAEVLGDLSAFEEALADESATAMLPLSSVYAYGALAAGVPYVNFAPSLGASCGALDQLARDHGVPHAGRDGKTGETLLKTVLAPMFVARNLRLLTWQGYNMLGNSDGAVLESPANLASKVASKDLQLQSITGNAEGLHTRVRIDYVPALGEWKTAWDFVQFAGFLGTVMDLQFTWRGCDSTLAAPLVLDLVRLVDLARLRGESGGLAHLAVFFKNPVATDVHDFALQMEMLRRHLADT